MRKKQLKNLKKKKHKYKHMKERFNFTYHQRGTN